MLQQQVAPNMTKTLILSVLIILITASVLTGQTEYLPKKVYKAYRLEETPAIDGSFDDPTWQQGEWAGGFIQHEPYADRPPSQPTEFKLAFELLKQGKDINYEGASGSVDFDNNGDVVAPIEIWRFSLGKIGTYRVEYQIPEE